MEYSEKELESEFRRHCREAAAATEDDDIVDWPLLAIRTGTSAPSVAARPRESTAFAARKFLKLQHS